MHPSVGFDFFLVLLLILRSKEKITPFFLDILYQSNTVKWGHGFSHFRTRLASTNFKRCLGSVFPSWCLLCSKARSSSGGRLGSDLCGCICAWTAGGSALPWPARAHLSCCIGWMALASLFLFFFAFYLPFAGRTSF